MAGDEDDAEKTEDPTGKKIEDAKKKGQFAKSQEFTAFIVLFVGFGGMLSLGPEKGLSQKEYSIMIFRWIPEVAMDPRDALVHAVSVSIRHLWDFFALPLVLLWVACISFGMIQQRFIIPEDPLKFDLKKLNPIEGFKEKFMSLKPFVELIKSLLKLGLLGYVVWSIIAAKWASLPSLIYDHPGATLTSLLVMASKIFWSCMPLIVIIIVLDFAYQWYDNFKKLKMSVKEIKDERKEAEGSPEVKAKQRQKQREFALGHFLREVPKADVVVVNPTHYSVAIRYRKEEADAPRVVAKGVDFMAMKIRTIATQHDIPIVENPPLARGLYAQTKEGQEIHPDFYTAVAEVLAMIYRRRNPNWTAASRANPQSLNPTMRQTESGRSTISPV